MPHSVRFSETLAGRLGSPSLSLADATRQGDDTRFLLTVVSPPIPRLVQDPDHRSPAWGCLLADWLSPEPLAVDDGRLDLFVDTSGDRRIVEMRYRLVLAAVDGARYVLIGTKELRRKLWFLTFPWDATTLTCQLHRGDDQGPLLAHGTLRQGIIGVLAQGATFRATSVGAWLGFFRYYLGTVLGVYFRRPVK